MSDSRHAVASSLKWLAPLVLLALSSRPSSALDLTGFVSKSSPDTVWGRGYGGAIGARFFGIATFEGEAAWHGGAHDELTMTTFSAAALLSPPIGRVTPYGGLCVGAFRQATRVNSDYGTLQGFVLGVRVSILTSLVIKAEYRNYNLSGTPLAQLDHRYSVGGGLSF
jgi:hypothetical protein